ncbi:prepilin-type N-terminal cleavage/methylation domain-containing protein [Acidovorax sp. Leaf160]|uniref:prepilin-type N-terminal cleavage/methylation domain-containing protein n=1 Tax=Acidovorax sp. Leaf160 TaxID=1736280 RepID=UPI0009E96C67|nr:prepilin-type N-terminal cleavage/methylation domain-containing protein [Acidovorax sp. Leaf160]
MKPVYLPHPAPLSRRQRGITLIELMVGITIGLLTVAVAMGALMVSRGASGTISDATQMQQQAAYAFRVIGQQLRQAGSIRLNLAATQAVPTTITPQEVVAFETSFDKATNTVTGLDSPSSSQFKLSVAYQNYTEANFSTSLPASLFRNCLGENGTATIVQSQFTLRNGSLHCAGTGGAQPVIRNVQDFQVWYLLQANADVGNPTIQRVNAAGVGSNWARVFAVEVCLDLFGDETVDIPAASTYQDCGNNAASFNRRLHTVFRNTYQIRSQGVAG